jgi:hypothetical protein
MHRFRHFAVSSMNCTRFLLRMIRYARAPLTVRMLEACSLVCGPRPALLVRMASRINPIYLIEQRGRSRCERWSRVRPVRPPVLCSAAFERCNGPAAPRQHAAGVPPVARWLSGTAVGKWIALTRESGLGRRERRFRRWSDLGVQDCDRVFAPRARARFDPTRPFEPGYPITCQQCTVHQDGRAIRLELSREFDRDSVDETPVLGV